MSRNESTKAKISSYKVFHLLLHVAVEAEEVDRQLLLGGSIRFGAQDGGEECGEELHRLTAGYKDDELLILSELK